MRLRQDQLSPVERLAKHGTDKDIIYHCLYKTASNALSLAEKGKQKHYAELYDRITKIIQSTNWEN